MPRFFFDVGHDRDDLGVELAGLADARRYALRYAGELIRDIAEEDAGEAWRLDVRHGDDRAAFSLLVAMVPASRAVEPPRSYAA